MPRLPCLLLLSVVIAAMLPATAAAAEPSPEIRRPPAAPQADGRLHTLRTIPEACARLEGRFTGHPAAPYALTAVRSRPGCIPRARLVDAGKAKPSVARGWVLNDVIRVPRASCPAQQATIRIWRTRVPAPAQRDAQGQVRVYLRDAMAPGGPRQRVELQQYAVDLAIVGRTCVR